MSSLRELQNGFLNYLLEKPSGIVNNIDSSGNVSAQRRLGLYADAYKLRLKEAITTDYEQLHTYLGDDMFDQLMNEYISQYPSHHTSLRYYSKNIPKLLSEKEPWTQAPELIEIATIEKAFCDSFDAADSDPVTLEIMSRIEPHNWPMLKIRFHDSVQLLPMQYNSFQIWQALSEGSHPPSVISDMTSWLIWRNGLVSQYSALSDAEVCALQMMMSGGDFSNMCEVLLDHYDEQETPQQAIALLQQWLSNGMVCQLK